MDILPHESVTFRFADSRPAEERVTRRNESSSGTKTIFGDSDITPPPPAIIRGYFARHIGELLKDKTVALNEFRVSAFDPAVSLDRNRFESSAQSVPNASAGGILLAAPLILGIESMKSEKTITVVIRGTVNGKDFSSFSSEGFRGRATEQNVQSMIVAALERAVDDIKKVLAQ
jgi:hypothetical protein